MPLRYFCLAAEHWYTSFSMKMWSLWVLVVGVNVVFYEEFVQEKSQWTERKGEQRTESALFRRHWHGTPSSAEGRAQRGQNMQITSRTEFFYQDEDTANGRFTDFQLLCSSSPALAAGYIHRWDFYKLCIIYILYGWSLAHLQTIQFWANSHYPNFKNVFKMYFQSKLFVWIELGMIRNPCHIFWQRLLGVPWVISSDDWFPVWWCLNSFEVNIPYQSGPMPVGDHLPWPPM